MAPQAVRSYPPERTVRHLPVLWQAVDQFRLFFDSEPPVEVMEKALYEELEKRK